MKKQLSYMKKNKVVPLNTSNKKRIKRIKWMNIVKLIFK